MAEEKLSKKSRTRRQRVITEERRAMKRLWERKRLLRMTEEEKERLRERRRSAQRLRRKRMLEEQREEKREVGNEHRMQMPAEEHWQDSIQWRLGELTEGGKDSKSGGSADARAYSTVGERSEDHLGKDQNQGTSTTCLEANVGAENSSAPVRGKMRLNWMKCQARLRKTQLLQSADEMEMLSGDRVEGATPSNKVLDHLRRQQDAENEGAHTEARCNILSLKGRIRLSYVRSQARSKNTLPKESADGRTI
ncbi:PREDICTED: putative pre-mRNA-splicing factor ATP-dependent RNA helicase DHX16 [Nelumbo nucifera]|uniref:Pre-mRNA-splicing factor ATP-dependent RNA helicase DHX16 n=2 Tax=Nelumbo nucifera TaxID=4432 RepID=A0A1U7ZYS4_NELNU|nr:PREDICTED: putative pre-mRNA-splicing factor ATP-dependent RNA helicase DHX16 [Nelumbo nucifera]XP_010254363.1 PREDICTED: putative pre-mRNA-splicing factor ATP-dependent RNA helicase DHX16 [Nelumbo nucifera]DAD27122.1 TPA_asm: hypothetical protein HUJ06_028590 [Nelumbo nucifera]